MTDSSVFPAAIDAVADLPVDVTNDTDNGSGSPRTGTVGWAAALFNRYSSAVRHIELELGTDPKGTFADVKTRLAARLTCRKTADEATFTTTTLANVTDLAFSYAAGLDYYFKFVVMYQVSATTTGIALAVNASSTPVAIAFGSSFHQLTAANLATNIQGGAAAIATKSSATTSTATGTNYIVVLEGIMTSHASTAGTLNLQASNVAAGTVTIKKGSYGEIYIN